MSLPYNPTAGDTYEDYFFDGFKWTRDTTGGYLMAKSIYDPRNRSRDVFDRRYHYGTIRQSDVDGLQAELAYLRSRVEESFYIEGETLSQPSGSSLIVYIKNKHYDLTISKNISLIIRATARAPHLNTAIFHIYNSGNNSLNFSGHRIEWDWQPNKRHELIFVGPVASQVVGSCRVLE